MRPLRRHIALALVTVAASVGMAGCVSQPWALPDTGGYGSSAGSSTYYPYGSSAYGYGYGSRYGYGYGAGYPYYYRQGVPLPYPAYGYSPYPSYPGYYCRDADRDGRCDQRRRDRDRDHDRDDDDDAGNDGRGSDRPLRDVRRLFREREQAAATRVDDTAPAPAALRPAPAVRPPAGAAPSVRPAPPPRAPSGPPARAEPRRGFEAAGSTGRASREEPASRNGPRDDPAANRRPLR